MATIRHSFFWKFVEDPCRTGALTPATPKLALHVERATRDAYAHQAGRPDGSKPLKLIELGAGTGALTQGIMSLDPLLVETDAAWAALLQQRFPQLEVRTNCAIEILEGLSEPVGLVNSIPLLNNPQAERIKSALESKYREGLIRFCVLYTYGWKDPLRGSCFVDRMRNSFVVGNFPPAFVWTYQ